MMANKVRQINLGMALVLLLTTLILILPNEALAGRKTMAIEGISYGVNQSMSDNLESFVGKRVSVILISGKTFTGFVKEVGPHLIHLEKLENKEYFDALIRTESITAIEAKFRK
jgi:small nuclear ribonucleoprotein (snRNP)-like protein